jgi:hypothetical protein
MAGLRWKIYAFNDEKSMGIGIYLFDEVKAMNSHMTSLREATNHLDHVSDLEMMVWEVQEALCKITVAPI